MLFLVLWCCSCSGSYYCCSGCPAATDVATSAPLTGLAVADLVAVTFYLTRYVALPVAVTVSAVYLYDNDIAVVTVAVCSCFATSAAPSIATDNHSIDSSIALSAASVPVLKLLLFLNLFAFAGAISAAVSVQQTLWWCD